MNPVNIIGVGMTKFGTLDDSLMGLGVKASIEAVQDAEAVASSFDHLVVGSQNPDEFTGIGHLSTLLADRLGLVPAGATRVESGPSSGASAFEHGFSLIASGMADLVLVLGVEKMSTVDRSTASRILAKMMSNENETQYGATPAALAAMVARRYMHEYGLERDDLSLVPVKAHRNGSLNHLAHFRNELTVEKVSNGRIVADPLTIYDCCPISDGAAALVLSSENATKDLNAGERAIRVLGLGHGTDHHAVQHRLSLTSFKGTVEAARKAFKMANLSPQDIDVCELHDAFSILELINIEDIGLVQPGTAIEAIKDERTHVRGDIPVNPTGGLKARGHPTGGSGVAQIRDIVLQLRGEAPKGLQVPSAAIGLSHSIGGFGNNMVVTILGQK